MKLTLAFLLLFYNFTSFANIKYIDLKKIGHGVDYSNHIKYLNDNIEYFRFWFPEWNFPVNRDSMVAHLKSIFKVFSALQESSNIELELLKGDIAHYLYNINVEEFYDSAESHYRRAISLAPADYRGYWFLGFHYALTNFDTECIKLFFKAQELAPGALPADFWDEYAFAAHTVNMPSHALYAMDMERKILKQPGFFETKLGTVERKRIIEVPSTNSYAANEIWEKKTDDSITFISRPLGIKIRFDSSWDLNFFDYKDRQAAFVIKPPPFQNKAGRSIGVTILILMKVAKEGETLDEYVNKNSSGIGEKKKFIFSSKYPMEAWEIKNSNVYPDRGGAHFHVIGIERNSPAYPGLSIEEPTAPPRPSESGKVQYYAGDSLKGRFKGKIYYEIVFDSCEDIYEESFTLFKKIFECTITIE